MCADNLLLDQFVDLSFTVTVFPQDFQSMLTHQRCIAVLWGVVAAELDRRGGYQIFTAAAGSI